VTWIKHSLFCESHPDSKPPYGGTITNDRRLTHITDTAHSESSWQKKIYYKFVANISMECRYLVPRVVCGCSRGVTPRLQQFVTHFSTTSSWHEILWRFFVSRCSLWLLTWCYSEVAVSEGVRDSLLYYPPYITPFARSVWGSPLLRSVWKLIGSVWKSSWLPTPLSLLHYSIWE